ncbi:hypothetical protein L218DRAFT_714649 [Marasmius fiardii PR-910]|nr:hypothetical protein L218DRAFT_714649 [Marasmius fiardii PR-910]
MRRSTRIQENQQEVSEDVKPKKKVQKITTPHSKVKAVSKSQKVDVMKERCGRKLKGPLEKLAKEAPMDVVLEVFSHLEPLDIINLSRTNKMFRATLMSPSARPIWRAALANVSGLPPLPPNLSEPRYAHFVFDPTCQGCYRGPCDYFVWECFIRCHKSCAQKLFFSMEELSKLKNWNEDVLNMMQRAISGGYMPHLRDRKILGGEVGYIPSIVKGFRLEYMEVKDDSDKFQKWELAKKKEYESLRKFTSQASQWHQSRAVSAVLHRQWEDLAPVRRRRDEIRKRLSASGWNTEDLMHRDFSEHPLVNRSKDLTDRGVSAYPLLMRYSRYSRSQNGTLSKPPLSSTFKRFKREGTVRSTLHDIRTCKPSMPFTAKCKRSPRIMCILP